jgi:hypothetical protein
MIFIKTTLILILSLSFVVYMVSGRHKAFTRLGLVIIYLVLFVFIISPPLADKVANFFGIGTGKDMIIYLATAAIWFFTISNHARIKLTDRNVTELVRKDALDSARKT